VSILSTLIQYSGWSLCQSNEGKELKVLQIRKEVKLSLFADVMALYLKVPKDATKIKWNFCRNRKIDPKIHLEA
jgi:hypothetical protein